MNTSHFNHSRRISNHSNYTLSANIAIITAGR